jgi:serine/threonine protein kinase
MTPTVPGYEVGELLGFGSHGEVWSGWVAGTGEQVALKRIPVECDTTARSARGEAALLSALSHPNLIELRQFIVIPGAVVLVLDLAEGGSLADLLERRDRLTPAEVAATLSPIAAALAQAHHDGVLHGDISASNILFTGSGQPKLTDLGVARLLGADATAIGTPAYVDPAVASGGAAGAASDVFSLAAVALHALTGSGPWRRGSSMTVAEVLAAAAAGVIEDLPGRLAGCPTDMAAVVMRGLDTEPHRRGSAAEFALDLRASAQPTAVVLSAGRVATPVGPPVGRLSTGARSSELTDQSGERSDPAPVSGRPAFTRPQFAQPNGVPADLTHVSRRHVRPVTVHAPGRGERLVGLMRRKLVRFALAGFLAAGAVTTLVIFVVLPISSPATSHASVLASREPDAEAADPTRILSVLDDMRSRAFAERRPELLKQVYDSASLLMQDVSNVQSRIPDHCLLLGLHTRYRDVTVTSRSPQKLTVRASASLTSGALRCAGQVRSRTAPAGPTVVRLVLVAASGGRFRIASQQIGIG